MSIDSSARPSLSVKVPGRQAAQRVVSCKRASRDTDTEATFLGLSCPIRGVTKSPAREYTYILRRFCFKLPI